MKLVQQDEYYVAYYRDLCLGRYQSSTLSIRELLSFAKEMESDIRELGNSDVRKKLCEDRGIEIDYEDLLLIDYDNNRFNVIKEKDLDEYR